MTRLFRGAFIVWVVLRYGLDELVLSSFRHPTLRLLTRLVSIGRNLDSPRGERLREALLRHIEKDLGPMALPRLPLDPAPFTVAEYFPDPTVSGYHDPRQHAVSLAYVVPCDGDCAPSQESLDLTWVSPQEAASETFQAEMTGGQGRLVRLALAFAGQLD